MCRTPDRGPKVFRLLHAAGWLAAWLFVGVSPAWAQPLAFVKSPGDRHGGKSRAAHLVDGDPNTRWCAADGVEHAAQISFKGPQRVDRVVVVACSVGQRVLAVRLSDGQSSVVVPLGEPEQPTELRLKKPLQGATYKLSLDGLGTPLGETKVMGGCLCTLSLFDGDVEATAAPAAGAAPQASTKGRAFFVGAWKKDPLGASEATLVLASDNTWSWVHEPLSGAAHAPLSGTYRVKEHQLWMRLGQTGGYTLVCRHHQRIHIDPAELGAPAADYDAIELGPQLATPLGGRYTNAQFH